MKKIIAMGAIAACASVFALESANIVGYATRSSELGANQITMVSPSFLDVGSDVVSVATIVAPSGVEAVGYDDQETSAAQIQVWNGTNYDVYYYINDAFDDYDENLTGWATEQYIDNSAVIAPGNGFWFKYPKAGANFTMSGEVSDADTITKDVYFSKVNMTGNPYPMNLDTAKITTSLPAVTYEEQETKGLQIQVWNGLNYTLYYYINDAFDDESENLTGWANEQYIENGGKIGTDVTFGLWVRCCDDSAVADANGKVGTITFAK